MTSTFDDLPQGDDALCTIVSEPVVQPVTKVSGFVNGFEALTAIRLKRAFENFPSAGNARAEKFRIIRSDGDVPALTMQVNANLNILIRGQLRNVDSYL